VASLAVLGTACGGSDKAADQAGADTAGTDREATTTTGAPAASTTTTAPPTTTTAPPVVDESVAALDLDDYEVSADANGDITVASPEGSTSMSSRDAVTELGGEVTERGIEVALPDTVLFDFGSAALRRDAREQLVLIAGLAAASPGSAVTVGGHADSVGEAADNQALSEDRADVVSAALQALGVDADRITATGFGETQPVAPNTNPDGSDNPEGRQVNRRVEVLVVGAELNR
jgi:outer membrane protein OmpA-like peptidoglycan-associated protein